MQGNVDRCVEVLDQIVENSMRSEESKTLAVLSDMALSLAYIADNLDGIRGDAATYSRKLLTKLDDMSRTMRRMI